jgi:hypothetical protein
MPVLVGRCRSDASTGSYRDTLLKAGHFVLWGIFSKRRDQAVDLGHAWFV